MFAHKVRCTSRSDLVLSDAKSDYCIKQYSVDSLLNLCTSFLSSYAAGNPIKAMSIAEMLSLPDLYKEGSKFVLDNLTGWSASELDTLSHETRWKLEKKRSWFLERLLKLSLSNVGRDYPCAATCPDPTHCARLLEEKWRQAYFAANRFGSPSPSITYRYLRQLDVPPFLMLERSACDSFARGWVLDREYIQVGLCIKDLIFHAKQIFWRYS